VRISSVLAKEVAESEDHAERMVERFPCQCTCRERPRPDRQSIGCPYQQSFDPFATCRVRAQNAFELGQNTRFAGVPDRRCVGLRPAQVCSRGHRVRFEHCEGSRDHGAFGVTEQRASTGCVRDTIRHLHAVALCG